MDPATAKAMWLATMPDQARVVECLALRSTSSAGASLLPSILVIIGDFLEYDPQGLLDGRYTETEEAVFLALFSDPDQSYYSDYSDSSSSSSSQFFVPMSGGLVPVDELPPPPPPI